MKYLYFVRHGQSEHNKAKRWAGRVDTPLTIEGHEQAKQTAKNIKRKGLNFDIIVSSPLSRARDTAKHIAGAIDYDLDGIIVDDLFAERHYGVLEGNPEQVSELEQKYKAGDETALDGFENVETIAELQDRAKAAIAYLQALPHNTVLLVGHGAMARAIRRELEGDTSYARGKAIENGELVRLI